MVGCLNCTGECHAALVQQHPARLTRFSQACATYSINELVKYARDIPGLGGWGVLWEGLTGKCPEGPRSCTTWCLSYGFGVTAPMEGPSWHLDRWLVPQQIDPSYGRGTTWQLRLVHQLVVGSGPRIPPVCNSFFEKRNVPQFEAQST